MKNAESQNAEHKPPTALAENASGLSEEQKAFAVVVGDALAERWRRQHVLQEQARSTSSSSAALSSE